MKLKYKPGLLLCISIVALYSATYATNDGWQVNSAMNTSFIENKGQYDGRDWQKDSKILYAIDYNSFYMFFTSEGFTYRMEKISRNSKFDTELDELREEIKEAQEGIHESDMDKKFQMRSELVNVIWLNANKNVEVIAEDKVNHYYSFAIKNPATKEITNLNHVNGFRRLTYKNLYDIIDVIYEVFPGKGIKYSIVVHPGGDISKVKLQYGKNSTQIKDERIDLNLDGNGDIIIDGSLGTIKELAPVVFYSDDKSPVGSSYKFNNNIISFNIPVYDNSREIVIDPWIVNSTFNTSTAVWEVETDAFGNVYVIGGETPMKLDKYNSGGIFQWSYSTPWDTASVWLGTLATDGGGDCFITSGTAPEMERINSSGGMLWHSNGGVLIGGDDEWWSITFNCDKTKLIVGGTKLFMFTMQSHAAIFDINLVNGDVLGVMYVHSQTFSALNPPIEVRSISSSKNAKYVFLTHNEVGAINQNIGNCPNDDPIFQVPNGHALAYKCENYLPATQNGGGLKAIIANAQYVYTSSGTTIFKRSLGDGSLIASATIPGGSNQTFLGKKVVHNSGLDVDDCGNVYAGSVNNVIKFDQNLNILSQAAVNFTVYDVSVNNNNEVIAVGAQNNNGSASRNGRIQALNMSACAQFTLTCCDANICHPDTLCTTDPPITLDVSSPGGTFSGPGITNPATGTFDPSVAGIGNHWVYYTQPCGTDSIIVTVINCNNPEACVELNGSITASGGNGAPYTFAYWQAASSTPITNQATCVACGGTWTPFVNICLIGTFPATNCTTPAAWITWGTGTNASAPPSYPIQITDMMGNSVTYNDVSAMQTCSSCPPINITVTSQTNPQCNGGTGSATISANGGSAPYTYAWTGGLTGNTQSGLTPATYTITATDANSCTGTYNVTITQPAVINIILTASTPAACGVSNGSATVNSTGGTGTITYTWSTAPPQTGATANGLTNGNYTVTGTDVNGCTSTLAVNITGTSGLTLDTSVVNSSCAANDGSATVTATGGTTPYTYVWSSGGTNATEINLGAGNYSVTVTDASGCSATVTAIITSPPNAPIITIQNQSNVTCNGLSNGSVSLNVTGGTTPYTYTWSPNVGSSSSATGLSAGVYGVSVTDDLGCLAPFQVTIIQPAALSITLTSTPSGCSSGTGTATANVTGGTNPYTYLWSPGGNTNAINTGLTAGNYNVVVTDANSCTISGNTSVAGSPPIYAATSATSVSCFGGSDGSAEALVYGGTPPFTYLWSDALSQTTQTALSLAVGTYTVTISDTQGCTVSATASITSSLQPVTITITATDVLCSGQNNGTATATPSGGTFPYYYIWSNGGTSSTIQNLSIGNYCVTVVDFQGCTSTNCIDITTPNPLVVTLIWSNSFCYGLPEGQITANVTGGTTPYSYLWSTGSGSSSLNNIIAGTYTVTVTDAADCTQAQSATISQPPQLSITITPDQYICPGTSAAITVSPAGGTYPYYYFWNGSPSGATITVNPSQTTTYSAYVTDANGCQSATLSTTVNIYSQLSLTASVSPDSVCPGDPVTIAVSVTGGSGPPYVVTGQDGSYISSTYVFYPNTSIQYLITAHDDCNQTATVTVPINVYPQPSNSFLAEPISGCMPLTVQFSEFSPNEGQSYVWDFGDQSNLSLDKNPTHVYTQSGVFDVTLTVTSVWGCSTVNVQNNYITIYPQPHAAFTYSPELVTQIKPEVSFTNLSTLSQWYMWFFGTGDSSSTENPVYVFPLSGTYIVTLVAVSGQNCYDTASVEITIQEQPSFYAPTAFSPDNDGTNDFWRTFATGIKEEGFTLLVFDRWGEVVFESTDIEKTWDGRIKKHNTATIGTYTWLVVYYDLFGNKHEAAGTVTVIR